MVPRFYDATQGQVYVDGLDVTKYKKEDIRNKVGLVPQKAVLFKGTMVEIYQVDNVRDLPLQEL